MTRNRLLNVLLIVIAITMTGMLIVNFINGGNVSRQTDVERYAERHTIQVDEYGPPAPEVEPCFIWGYNGYGLVEIQVPCQ